MQGLMVPPARRQDKCILSAQSTAGTGSPALMCKEHVNRGPLKNDVSISMLMLGCPWEERHLSESKMGHNSSRQTRGSGVLSQEKAGAPGGCCDEWDEIAQHAHLLCEVCLQTSPRLISSSWKTVLAPACLPKECHCQASRLSP